ncbi:MAG: glycosyltransferase, partial [Acidimicrobiales bacterium]
PGLDEHSPALCEAAVAPIGGRPVPNLVGIDVDGLAALMRGADLLCLPSLGEGFGLPVAEAMACGTPVVVSDRGSLPEVVGRGGVVVQPTHAGLVDGLRDALSRRAELAPLARERGQELSWVRTAEATRRSLVLAVRGG